MDEKPTSFFEPSWKKYFWLFGVCMVYSFVSYWWMQGFNLMIPMFWAIVFFTPLIIDFVPRMFSHPGRVALQEFQGVHYQFNGYRVRVLYAEQLVWLVTQDIYAALGKKLGKDELRRLVLGKRHREIPGTKLIGISEQHLTNFVSGLRAQEGQRFILWFEREVLKPIRTKVERGLPIVEEVIIEGTGG